MENKDSSPQTDTSSDESKGLASKWDRALLKISKLFRNSQKVCRGLAILDAVVSIIVLAVFLVRRVYVTHKRSHSTEDHLLRVLFLSWKLFEIVFALILYEGVRREIKWMVKWWLIYCIGRLTIVYPFAIYKIYVSQTTSLISITGLLVCLGLTWVIFQLIQGIIILAIHKNPQEMSDPDEDSQNEADFEQFEMELQSEPISEEERA